MDTQLIVRLIVSIVAAVNMFAAAFGFNPLNLDEQTIYTAVSALVTLAAWVWGFWKNNNFTEEAKAAQVVLDEAKATKKETAVEE